jgi:alpha-1,3-mannosyltransferase
VTAAVTSVAPPTRPLKVTHVVRQFWPSIGGLEDVVLNLSAVQRETHGIDASVVTLDTAYQLPDQRLPHTDTVRGVPIRRMAWFGPKSYPIAPSVLGMLRGSDVVHVHWTDFFFDYLALTKWLHGCRLIVSTHGGFFHTQFARVPKLVFFNTVTRLSLRSYDCVVACSEADAQLFRKITRRNLVTIENGADVGKFRDAAARTPQRVLVCFGRFASNKRIETLFPLLRELRQLNPAWRLIVAGAETDVSADFLEAEAQNAGVAPAVTVSARPSDAELRGLIGQATYFICASSYEGFGIAAVEALSAGLVPILTNIPPFARLLRKAGLGVFYDPDDPVAEARRIEELASTYDGHLRGAAMHAAASYGWEAVTASYVDVYRHLAARSRAWPRRCPALP